LWLKKELGIAKLISGDSSSGEKRGVMEPTFTKFSRRMGLRACACGGTWLQDGAGCLSTKKGKEAYWKKGLSGREGERVR